MLASLHPSKSKRIVAALAIGLHLVSMIPLPRVTASERSGLDKSYPCEGEVCGCSSEDDCWRSCCCYSPAQRLAWARRHGITPPSELQRSLAGQLCENSAQHGEKCCADQSRESGEQATSWVLVIAAQKCRGHAWSTGSPAVTMALVATVRRADSSGPSSTLVALPVDGLSPQCSTRPPVPPPR